MGRGPRPDRLPPLADQEGTWPAGPGRVRVGQVLQRGGVPLPEADAGGARDQQRRSLHAAVPRLVGGRPARRDRLGGGFRHFRQRPARRLPSTHRDQHDRQPPGRGHVLQAGGQARHQAARRRPPPAAHRRLRHLVLPDPPGHRRGVLQRAHARPDRRGPDRRGLHPRPDRELRGPAGSWSPSTRPSASPRCAAFPRSSSCEIARAIGRAQEHDGLLGHGDQPAHRTGRTTPAA